MASKCGSVRKSKCGAMVVAAIDFGTTFSGYAFSFSHDYEKDPTKVSSNTSWVAGSAGLISLKTPTVLLLDDKKKFVAFGYEAEEKYSTLAGEDNHKSHYYFRRFKMLLHKVSGSTDVFVTISVHVFQGQLTRDVLIPDDKGRELPALTVFSISINYLRKHLMDTLNKRITGVLEKDIRWVLTVPAIWSDGSKQFMREAAERAGIKDNLIIALEPEAASLFCMHLPIDKMIMGGGEKGQASPFQKGTRYMVVDVGGGTVDITIHEVVDKEQLKELNFASGGAWGGTCVDRAFENFLRKIVDNGGKKVFDKFQDDAKEDWIDLFREFEIKKRSIQPHGATVARAKETIKIPVILGEICNKVTGKSLKTALASRTDLEGKVMSAGDKLRVDADIFRSWFDDSCNNTVNHIKDIFKQKASARTDTILLVGGFSESPILQQAIKKNFPDKRLIIPEEAGLAVLRGAVIFGHNPVTIVSRIAKCSYGVRVFRDFQDGVHPKNKKIVVNGKEKCKDVFAVHVKKGQELKVGEAQTKQRYTPLEADQVSLVFDIYTSTDENPLFVTDIGCSCIGQLEVEVPDISGGKERGVWIQMIFGGTEIVVEAREERDNSKPKKAKFDFLTSQDGSDCA